MSEDAQEPPSPCPGGGRRYVCRTRNYLGEAGRVFTLEDDDDEDGDAEYEAIFNRTAPAAPEPLNKRTLSKFLCDAAGRGAPIEPDFLNNVEIHVICSSVPDILDRGFVAHYTRFNHSLELRAMIDLPTDFFGDGVPCEGTFLVGLSMGFNRQYPSLFLPVMDHPEKSLNHPMQLFSVPINPHVSRLECNVELGRGIASLAYAGAALGWEVRLLGPALGLRALKHLMGLTKETDLENEGPMAALIVFPVPDAEASAPSTIDVLALGERIIECFHGDIRWFGCPYVIRQWDEFPQSRILSMALRERVPCQDDQKHVILDRTPHAMTAQGFNYPIGTTLRRALHSRGIFEQANVDRNLTVGILQFEQFVLRFCAGTHPRRQCFPHGLLPWRPKVNVFFLVYRVPGLEPGLYGLARNPSDLLANYRGISRERQGILQHPALASRFFFAVPAGDLLDACPFVDVAVDGSPFAVAMVTKHRFEREDYIWEAGILGEMLAVEAEAQGFSACPRYSQYFRHFWPDIFGIHPMNGDLMCVYSISKKYEEPLVQRNRKRIDLSSLSFANCCIPVLGDLNMSSTDSE